MRRVSRSDLIVPLRYVLNFRVYRKYIKRFDVKTKHGRQWLYELKRNMDIMGFNEGIEAFELWYEGDQKIGRSIVQGELSRMSRMQDFQESMNEYELIEAMKPRKQKTKSYMKNVEQRKDYDPNWKPKKKDLERREPRAIKKPYDGIVRKEYDIKEKGLYVMVIEVFGEVEKVLVGKNILEIIKEASEYESIRAQMIDLRRTNIVPVDMENRY